MVRAPEIIDSSTTQFLLNLTANDYLDPQTPPNGDIPHVHPTRFGYCVFGEVVSGIEVIDKIAKVDVQDANAQFGFVPRRPIIVESVGQIKPSRNRE